MGGFVRWADLGRRVAGLVRSVGADRPGLVMNFGPGQTHTHVNISVRVAPVVVGRQVAELEVLGAEPSADTGPQVS